MHWDFGPESHCKGLGCLDDRPISVVHFPKIVFILVSYKTFKRIHNKKERDKGYLNIYIAYFDDLKLPWKTKQIDFFHDRFKYLKKHGMVSRSEMKIFGD